MSRPCLADDDTGPMLHAGHGDICDQLRAFRDGFPLLRSQTYLATCERGILHEEVMCALSDALGSLIEAGREADDFEALTTSARAKFARLMNVPADTVALASSVGEGISSVASALPLAPGSNIVISADVEHPNNVLPWLARGVEIRRPPSSTGGVDAEAVIRHMDGRTQAVSCASVAPVSGCRTDLQAIGDECRRRGIFFMVDGVQSAGILAHDLAAAPIDGFATSTAKGLLGLSGFGFVYVAEAWISRLAPQRAVKQTAMPPQGPADLTFRAGSRRFDSAGLPRLCAIAADKALDLLLGLPPIEPHVLALAARLRRGGEALGLRPCTHGGSGHSHIVSFAFSGDAGAPDGVARLADCSRALTEAEVAHSVRGNVLRFGFHGFNDERDVEHVLGCLASFAGRN